MTKVGGRTIKSSAGSVQKLAQRLEYVPHYVFNIDHLWQVHSRDSNRHTQFQDYCRTRRFWNKFDPSFAAGVLSAIYDQALKGKIPDAALSTIKRKSLWLDVNILTYDPRDHFDNGYIPEGWARVNSRLAAFAKDNTDSAHPDYDASLPAR